MVLSGDAENPTEPSNTSELHTQGYRGTEAHRKMPSRGSLPPDRLITPKDRSMPFRLEATPSKALRTKSAPGQMVVEAVHTEQTSAESALSATLPRPFTNIAVLGWDSCASGCPHYSPYGEYRDCTETVCWERVRLENRRSSSSFSPKLQRIETLTVRDLAWIKDRDFVRNPPPRSQLGSHMILKS